MRRVQLSSESIVEIDPSTFLTKEGKIYFLIVVAIAKEDRSMEDTSGRDNDRQLCIWPQLGKVLRYIISLVREIMLYISTRINIVYLLLFVLLMVILEKLPDRENT